MVEFLWKLPESMAAASGPAFARVTAGVKPDERMTAALEELMNLAAGKMAPSGNGPVGRQGWLKPSLDIDWEKVSGGPGDIPPGAIGAKAMGIDDTSRDDEDGDDCGCLDAYVIFARLEPLPWSFLFYVDNREQAEAFVHKMNMALSMIELPPVYGWVRVGSLSDLMLGCP